MRRSEKVSGKPPSKQCDGILPLADCGEGWVKPPRIPRRIYSRFKRVQAELLLDVADTLNLLVDLYYRVKNGELVPREKCSTIIEADGEGDSDAEPMETP